MRVLRVTLEAPVTSFRYPHFLIGRQITYDMPPPSTVYGHVMSATGELWAPGTLEFGYNFTFKARATDLEHQHIWSRKTGKRSVSYEITVQPHHRDFLYDCHLELYLRSNRLDDLHTAFRNPVFCVNLGRSQDLASIRSVEEIELQETSQAYLENTILPFDSMRERVGRGITVTMPRYVGPPPEREPATFGRYVVLRDRVFAGVSSSAVSPAFRLLNVQSGPETWWVDPETLEAHGVRRAVVFHRFVDA